MGAVTLGLDLGQRRDYTAIAVVEHEARMEPDGIDAGGSMSMSMHYVCRHLERLPLGTTYPVVARRVGAVAAGAGQRAGWIPKLYVDATGVGTPIVDLLREARVEADLVPVYFTHGDRRTEENGEVKLGKAWLVTRLKSLLQTERLHLPRTPDADALIEELLDYEIRVNEHANDTYGAFKVGAHDDLVTALGLAAQVEAYLPLPASIVVYTGRAHPARA